MSQWRCAIWAFLSVFVQCEGTYRTPKWNLHLRDSLFTGPRCDISLTDPVEFATAPPVLSDVFTTGSTLSSERTSQNTIALNISSAHTSTSISSSASYTGGTSWASNSATTVLPSLNTSVHNAAASIFDADNSSVTYSPPTQLTATERVVEASLQLNTQTFITNDDSIRMPFGSALRNATIAQSILMNSSSAATNTTSSLTANCPTSYPSNYPVSYSTPELCYSMYFARDDPSFFFDYADRCLGGWCNTQKWETPASGSVSTTTRTYFSGIEGTGSWEGVITAFSFWTLTYTISLEPSRLATTLSPCCGRCYFTAETIGLFYWPPETAKAEPSVTGQPPGAVISITTLPPQLEGTYIDEEGFTFISPSIYLAFTTLYGSDMCGIVGKPLSRTTLAFDTNQISTYNAETINSVCSVIDPDGEYYYETDFQLPPPVPITIADIAQNCSTLPLYYYLSEHPYNQDIVSAGQDPCHPIIHIPEKIERLQPEWAGCIAGYRGGFFDPPRTLRQGTVLVPTTAQPGPGISAIAPQTSSGALSSPRPTDPVEAGKSISTPSPSRSRPIAVPEHENPPSIPQIPEIPGQPDPLSPIQDLTDPKSPIRETSSMRVAGSLSSITVIIIATEVVLAPGSLWVVGGITSTLPGGIITVAGGKTFPVYNGQIGGELSTLPNGQVTVVDGTPIVVSPPQISRGILEGIMTKDVNPTRQGIVATFGTRAVTANELTQFILDKQTLRINGPAVTIDGSTFIMTTNSLGFTEVLAGSTSVPSTLANVNVITIGDRVLSPNPQNDFIFGTKTLNMSASFMNLDGTMYERTVDERGRTIFIAIGTTSYDKQATATSADLVTSAPKSSDQPTIISTAKGPKNQGSRRCPRWDLLLLLLSFWGFCA
ncbi:hypothetical protein IQ07DRAFT_640704 [Pyrenochaeta sp. DS3sAY3a]|nr:hypothetical protein IQ07DRAFT_640704 [Pyrenochaeta sp. DS3sAY3a]